MRSKRLSTTKVQPWAHASLHHGELEWGFRPMDSWQVELIQKECARYRKLFLKWIKGFTIIELVVALAILTILAAITIPAVGVLMRRSQETSTQANLSLMRSAIARYMIDHEGIYPTNLNDLVAERYINKIPFAHTPPYHPRSSVVQFGSQAQRQICSGTWYFFTLGDEARVGKLIVNCHHLTLKDQYWDGL